METESITPFHKLYKKHVHSDDGRVSMLRQVWSDIEKDLLGGQKMQGWHQISMALNNFHLISEIVFTHSRLILRMITSGTIVCDQMLQDHLPAHLWRFSIWRTLTLNQKKTVKFYTDMWLAIGLLRASYWVASVYWT